MESLWADYRVLEILFWNSSLALFFVRLLREGRLALQAAEEPTDDQGGVVALLGAVEPRQVPLQEAGQAVGAIADGVGGDRGVVQEGLGLGVIQERHRDTSETGDVSSSRFRICERAAAVTENRLQ